MMTGSAIPTPLRPLLLLFLLFLLAGGQPLRAQTPELTGRVMDHRTGAGIPFATILMAGKTGGTVTDATGYFRLVVSHLPITLRVSSVGYATDSLVVNRNNYLEINLKAVATTLPEIEVTASNQWRVLNVEKVLPLDFTICQGRLYLLSKLGLGRKYHLAAYSADGQLLRERTLNLGKITGIQSNCLDHLTLITPSYAIRLAAGKLLPIEKMPLADYELLFADCRAAADQYVYLEKSKYRGLDKRYYYGDKLTGMTVSFKQIRFTEELLLARRQQPFLAKVDGMNNMGDLTYEENQEIRGNEDEADFIRQVLLNNNNQNHLFAFQDTVLLVNFDQDQLEFYHLTGQPKGVVPIHFNGINLGRKANDAPVYRDPITGRFYTILLRRGQQRLFGFDLRTGQVTQEYDLAVADLQKLAILNGMAYLLGVPLRNRTSAYQRFSQRPLIPLDP